MTNLQIAGQEPLAVSAPLQGATGVVTWIIATAGMIALMLAPAVWNGFPIIFPDTGGYFSAPILRDLANGRSALYGLFLNAGPWLAFWPCVIAQSALMAWLVVVTLRVNGLGGRPFLALGIVALLCVVTSLPWFAGQLMPDILFAAAALSLYLLAYADAQLVRWERWLLGAIIAFGMASHMAAAGMAVAVIMALALTRISFIKLPQARLGFAAASVAAGILLCPVSNVALTGSFAFTPGGNSFLFGRLIEDGIVQEYLEDRCPDVTIKLCPYKDELKEDADSWLWWKESPLYKLGGWEAYEPEAKRIIRETLLTYPRLHLEMAIDATIAQFFSFETEVGIDDNEPTHWMIEQYTPHLVKAFEAARQQAERFDVGPLNWLHLPVAYLALAAMAFAVIFRRRLGVSDEAYALCLVLFAALAANAVICGVFSHPVDRYQSRLVLLAPFVVAIIAARRFLPSPQQNG